MSTLRKQPERVFVYGQPAAPERPAFVVCPTPRPGFTYVRGADGTYRLVSTYTPPVNTPTWRRCIRNADGSGYCI